MTQAAVSTQLIPLRTSAWVQVVVAVAVASGSFLPALAGASYPSITIVAVLFGVAIAESAAVSFFLASRLPSIGQHTSLATISLIVVAVVGNVGGLFVIFTTEPFIVGLIVGLIYIFVTFGVGILALSARTATIAGAK